MRIRFDPRKRLRTLEERGLDFLDAESVCAGPPSKPPIAGETMVRRGSFVLDCFEVAL